MTELRLDVMTSVHAKAACADQYPPWLWDSLDRFQDLKFGLFLHWGQYCQWGCIESWPLVEDDAWARPDDLACWVECGKDLARFRRNYWALHRTFNPTQFDPAAWADAARAAGMRYVAFTTKHHDGFCLFDTRTTDYRITAPECPFHADPRANIVRQVFDAFRVRDLGISCYFSKSDWHSPYYWDPDRPAHDRNPNYDTHAEPERWAKFADFVYRQIEELVSGYGPLLTLWLDGGQVRPPDQDINMARIADMARAHQPGLIIADRTVGGLYENILTPEQEVPDEPLGHPWESCLTMGTSWSYKPNDTYKSARTLIHLLADIVSKGGNLILNIGPTPDGTLPTEALSRLREIGDWMAVNAEAIYGTRVIAPYKAGHICFTHKAGQVYAIILAEEGQAPPPTAVTLSGLTPRPGVPVHLLGHDAPLDWQMTPAGARVTLPWELPCEHAWTLRFAEE